MPPTEGLIPDPPEVEPEEFEVLVETGAGVLTGELFALPVTVLVPVA